VTAVDVLDPRSEAIAAYRQSLADGDPLTQVELGARVGMSRSWARDLMHELRLVDSLDAGSHDDPVAPVAADIDAPVADTAAEWPPPGPVVAATVADTEPAAAATAPALADTERSPWWQRLAAWWGRSGDGLTTLVVALVAAAASYGHMYHVASLAGESVWIARAWPITVDGLALIALRRGHGARRWLVLGLLVSVAANVVAQYPATAAEAGPFIAAWPPLALYGCHHMTKHRTSTTLT